MECGLKAPLKITDVCLLLSQQFSIKEFRERVISDFHCSIICNSKKIGNYLSEQIQGSSKKLWWNSMQF